MTSDEFIAEVKRSESPITDSGLTLKAEDLADLHAAWYVFCIAGKVLDTYKKHIFYGKDLDLDVIEELYELAPEAENVSIAESPREDVHLSKHNARLFHGLLGKLTEAEEISSALRDTFSGTDIGVFDYVNILEELGDDQWYDHLCFDAMNVSRDLILEKVTAKLRKRYEKSFTKNEALNRDLAGERKVLES